MNRATFGIGTLALLAMAAEAHSQVSARSYSDGGVATARASGMGDVNLHAEAAASRGAGAHARISGSGLRGGYATGTSIAVSDRGRAVSDAHSDARGWGARSHVESVAGSIRGVAISRGNAFARGNSQAVSLTRPPPIAAPPVPRPTPMPGAVAAVAPWPSRNRWPTPTAARRAAGAASRPDPTMAGGPSAGVMPWDLDGAATPTPACRLRAAPDSVAEATRADRISIGRPKPCQTPTPRGDKHRPGNRPWGIFRPAADNSWLLPRTNRTPGKPALDLGCSRGVG